MHYAIGNRLFSFLVFLYELAELLLGSLAECIVAVRHGLRPVLGVYLRQVYFTGWEALKTILAIALIIGTAVITQIIAVAGTGNEYLIGKIMVWVVVRELAPLLTAIILIARSGAAIAAELAQMKISGEIEIVESLGIAPLRYLVMPRILAFTTAILILTVYFDVVGVLGSIGLVSLGRHVPLDQYIEGILAVLSFGGIVVSLGKVVLFGLSVSAICCRAGLGAEGSLTQVPRAASRAVMQSILAVFLIDALVSLFFLVL